MSSSDTILVLDDDIRIRELLRDSLESEGFIVLESSTSSELYRLLDENQVDLITMDVMLENENGLDLVREIRKASQVPIILVTGRIELIDTVVGLEIGADDYITKPFLFRELVARVRSVLRRSRTSSAEQNTPCKEKNSKAKSDQSQNDSLAEIVNFDNWSLNTASRELRNSDNRLVNLTTTEYELLDIFIKSARRVLSREYLMERLTGKSWHPSDRVIDNHVAQLRKKVEIEGDSELIKTVRGAGYMFTAKTTQEHA